MILFLYVAMNMHWEPQKLAFPKLPKGMEWNLVLATEEGGRYSDSAGERRTVQRADGGSLPPEVLQYMKAL